jgi:hypothetical protein
MTHAIAAPLPVGDGHQQAEVKTAQHKSQRSDDHAHPRDVHPPPSVQNERRVTPRVKPSE